MKRSMFLALAAVAALFAVLIALDSVNFETDRIDRWVMIFSIAGAVFFIGLATFDVSQGETSPSAEPTSSRQAAQRALRVDRPDPATLPSRPGSLLRAQAAAEKEPEEADTTLDLVALESDPIDAELQGIIDEEQMEEITALVRLAEAMEQSGDKGEPSAGSPLTPPAEPASPEAASKGEPGPVNDETVPAAPMTPPAHPRAAAPEPSESASEEGHETSPEIVAASDDEAQPLARLELRLADYDDEALRKVVKESESLVIAEMVRTGQLTDAGELTERDIASMVFLAYTSEEMLAELRLRKAMDQPGEVAVTDRALAPLKNIE